MFDRLGVPLEERSILWPGVAVDAVVDSVSVPTTFKKQLSEKGIIFSSFSEAVKEHPDLVRKYLGSVVPYTDNFFATLNSAVFSDWFILLHSTRRKMPDGAVYLLPHQCCQYRSI
jgi:Fe-S cluster assembly protein SufB